MRRKLKNSEIHKLTIRVYYEDTDMAGIVYYANYLRYIERARSDWVREIGVDQNAMKSDAGVVFAVRRVEADYLSPAHFDDQLTVETNTVNVTAARLVMEQSVKRGQEVLFQAIVTIVCISETGHPTRLPANIRLMLH